MKVVHYASSISHSAGGLYYSVSGLAKAQRELGLDVLVIGGADDHFEADRKQWGEVPLSPHHLRHRYGLSLQVFWRIAVYKPDIVHVHGVWSAASVYAVVCASWGIPVVVSPRGMFDTWILSQNRLAKKLHGAVVERPLLRRAYVHALNESERRAAIQYMPSAVSRVFVIPNGVDCAAANAELPHFPRAGALYLGRLHPKKQVLELVRRWGESQALKGTMLTVAGWGASEYEAELKLIVSTYTNVVFVGPLYGPSKVDALRKTRFFVLPSLSEGLPMSVLEALNAGVIPVITSECNLPELFEANIAKRISSDMSDVDNVMASLLGLTETELDDLSIAGSIFARKYQWPAIAERMTEQYRSILVGTDFR